MVEVVDKMVVHSMLTRRLRARQAKISGSTRVKIKEPDVQLESSPNKKPNVGSYNTLLLCGRHSSKFST
jgi:hypothetical protein